MFAGTFYEINAVGLNTNWKKTSKEAQVASQVDVIMKRADPTYGMLGAHQNQRELIELWGLTMSHVEKTG